MSIRKFYKNQEVFITGGSGFIGKATIEKLLRSCPNVGNIYVLMRSKKNRNPEERLRDILKSALYNRIRQENPQVLKKVIAIEGNCAELGLGIKPENLEKLRNVSIVIHSAASVRFDDALRDAIILNTRGTHELIKIAETLKNLKVFVHISTTYCNPDKQVVEEEVYPAFADWRTTIKLAETYNTETLNILNLKYSNNQPNTYTFTKGLSEQIINDYKNKLPLVIFRPSIVISSLIEPFPGWVDNFNGPIGLLVACGTGIMRTMYGDPDIVSDFVPVDIAVRALLMAAYDRAMEPHDINREDNDLKVINCATASVCPITTGQIIEYGKEIVKKNPFDKTLWVPGGSITRCPAWNFIRFITMHVFMAVLVDSALRFLNQKPFLLKVQRRIYMANLALHYFATTSWVFKNKNLIELDANVSDAERDIFGFMQYADTDQKEFLSSGLRGAKEFLLLEKPISSKRAIRRFKFLEGLQYFVKFISILLIARFIIRFIYTRYYMK
ncbi:putative fatty acyl-CoA reductase CG5065 [Teleopsis dalmanni]|uniref:putative fatty acyl-CoA reductase CG5065 n=1 Tax=Teleopsis dalmanni TaxID=139649 RepID=UPI0018CCCD17|nr:putative fatty acyl-CoA reductase CG5065 [Teleopsis dalmanni]